MTPKDIDPAKIAAAVQAQAEARRQRNAAAIRAMAAK